MMKIIGAKAYEKVQKTNITKTNEKGSRKLPVKGEIIKGEIQDVRQDKVTVKLADGQIVQAKTSEQFEFNIGQKVTFEVKESSQEQLIIRPVFQEGEAAHAKILDILQSANKPVTAENINLVMKMMEGNMPIDQNALTKAISLMNFFKGTDVDDILFLLKNDMVVSEEVLEQLGKFKSNEGRVLESLATLSEDLADIPFEKGEKVVNSLLKGNEGLLKLYQILHKGENQTIGNVAVQNEGTKDAGNVGEGSLNVKNQVLQTLEHEVIKAGVTENVEKIIKETVTENNTVQSNETELAAENKAVESNENSVNKNVKIVLQDLMSDGEVSQLNDKMKAITEQFAKEHMIPKEAFDKVNFTELTQKSVEELLKELNNEKLPTELKNKLLGLIREEVTKGMIKNEVLMSKSILANPKAYNQFYEKLSDKINDLIKYNTEITDEKLGKVMKEAANIKNNIEFMTELNKNFNFLQFPLYMENHMAKGELYVFNNKKELKKNKGNVTALVSLDLRNLGHLDAYVVKTGNAIDCKFYIEDELAAKRINEHLTTLHNGLSKAGFNVTALSVVKKDIRFDVVEDFLEEHTGNGDMKRMSFDMRA